MGLFQKGAKESWPFSLGFLRKRLKSQGHFRGNFGARSSKKPKRVEGDSMGNLKMALVKTEDFLKTTNHEQPSHA